MFLHTDIQHTKKAVSGTWQFLVVLLVTVTASLILTTLVLTVLDENHNTDTALVISSSDLFSELLYHLDPFPKAFAAVGFWAEQTSGTNKRLNHVHFINSTHGYAVGSSGTYISTNDTGKTWVSKGIGTGNDIGGISFFGDVGRTSGGKGNIRYTTNAGETWSNDPRITTDYLYDVHAYGTLDAVAVGNDGTILKTNSIYTLSVGDLNYDPNYVFGDSVWSPVAHNSTENVLRAVHSATVLTNGAAADWAVGDNKTIISNRINLSGVLADGNFRGDTWYAQDSGLQAGVNYHFNDVFFHDPTRGWIVGNGGTVLVTKDAGRLWESQDTNFNTHLNAVHFANSKEGWAVGFSGKVISTTDGGKNWNEQDTIAGTTDLYGLYAVNENNVWAVGESGIIMKYSDTGPSLIDPTPTLNLLTGTLTFEFDEIVDVSAVRLSGITITDSSGRNGVTLTGATISGGGGDSDTLTIRLTEEQRRSLTLLQHGPRSLLQVDIAATAIQDPLGNISAGVTNAQLSTT